MSVFSAAEQRAWAPEEKLKPSEWAERYRYLPNTSAEPGRYRLDRTPYAREILDITVEPGIEEIVFLKCVQVGFSTICETLIGYWVDQDPGPCLYVMPDQKAAEEVLEERIRPLVNSSPAVQRHITGVKGDDTKQGIKFDTMPLHMAWATSPVTLARRAIRYGVFDEIAKFPNSSGGEAPPIELGIERTTTFGHRRRILLGSTPKTRNDNIWKAWESCPVKLRYNVPCPHCSHYQTLLFPQIKKIKVDEQDRQKEADLIEQKSLAWYECISCNGRIEERHKTKMLAQGKWVADGQQILKDGTIVGERIKSKRVGFWLNAIYSPWQSFASVIAQHTRSIGDPGKMQNFKNAWLAEPFEVQVKAISVEHLREKFTLEQQLGILPPSKVVPKWAGGLVTTADVMEHTLYWSTRAFGQEGKSQLINCGIVASFDELIRQGLNVSYPIEGHDGLTFPVQRLLIDEGYRRDEVLELCQQDNRIIAIKGVQKQETPVKHSAANYNRGLALWLIDTTFYKDRITTRDPTKWLLNRDTPDEYLRHLAAEHKVIEDGKMVWKKLTEGMPNHWLDCEVYLMAAPDIFQFANLPTEQSLEALRTEQQRIRPPVIQQQRSSWIGNTSNWIKGR